jgi:hypothetical protein
VIAQVELRCECGRTARQTRSVVLERKAQGKPMRCICGKELILPPDVAAEAAPPKSVKRVRAKCPLCDGAVTAAEEGAAFSAKCAGCAISFSCDEQGKVEVDVPRTPPATAAELEKLIPRFSQRVVGAELLRAVQWRCGKNAASIEELSRCLDAMDRLAAWKTPPTAPFLPLPLDLAVPLVPVVFRAAKWEILAEGEGVSLIEEVTEGEPGVLAIGLHVAKTRLVPVRGVMPEARRLRAESQFFAKREPGSGGSGFTVKVYVDRKQQYFAADEAEHMVGELFRGRAALEAFFRAQLLFGPMVTSGNVLRVARLAVISRLQQVGFAAADAARMAPYFLET